MKPDKYFDYLGGDLCYIYYDPESNAFYDEDGAQIDNIFELITPNDLYLYRHDPGCNLFPCRFDRELTFEIVDQMDDYPGDGYYDNMKETYDENEYFDVDCSSHPGVECRVYCRTDAERREICRACGG